MVLFDAFSPSRKSMNTEKEELAMKSCRKNSRGTNRTALQQSAARSSAVPSSAAVHRYVHPIRTARPAAAPVEELLADVLEALSRQSEQLEEVLRRLERDNSDTM